MASQPAERKLTKTAEMKRQATSIRARLVGLLSGFGSGFSRGALPNIFSEGVSQEEPCQTPLKYIMQDGYMLKD